MPEIDRQVAAAADVTRIVVDEATTGPADSIFGEETAGETWCYFYQKAGLARQDGKWDQVVALWGEAQAKDFKPGNGVEYLPFIYGFAFRGEWEQAADLTLQANRITHVMEPRLCAAWNEIETQTSAALVRDQAIESVKARLKCPE